MNLKFSFNTSRAFQDLYSFPTRRSSDLAFRTRGGECAGQQEATADQLAEFFHRQGRAEQVAKEEVAMVAAQETQLGDRKSTRLNSSHLVISYAVFCLKKKKNIMLDIILI